MNSNYGKSNMKSGSMNNFDFDFGLNTGRSRSLNDQKHQTSSYSSSAQSKPYGTASWTNQPNTNKASWTHQPVGSLSGPTSMVGDIFGKTWGSAAPSNTGSASTVGIVTNKDPNLFGDLVNSALGQNKGGSNMPLKNSTPVTNKSSFSMGGMADSLPKTGSSVKSSGTLGGSNQGFGNFTSGGYNTNVSSGNANMSAANNRSSGLGGTPMSSMAGGVGGMGSKKDPFSTLVDFGSKPAANMNSGSKGRSSATSHVDDAFGDFQNASKSGSSFSSNAFPTSNNASATSRPNTSHPKVDDVFGDFQNASKSGSSFSSNDFPTSNNASAPLNTNTSHPKVDDFGFSNNQPHAQSSGGAGDFDSLFQSSTTSFGGSAVESQQFSGGDDWGFESEFGGGHDNGGTTELEGLPPPPAGLSASTAKSKGMDNYKQGQYADAIKWLSWAVVLLEKTSDITGTAEVLSSRASCYKEVGEYKKAVADCTKVLDHDEKNVSVLVQRALLYENMEKYKLGAEDLRIVMKLDPTNRVARSTIHRLTKMAG
ncbi:uncharacterized protein LOC116016751 [Ipomoea triloba]|uniref:uncharacterized protein LOC116016751 n=1 Tax=Ipomoea triloba TaxID=35885 RepID=UPI00125CE1B5|nr:uncharacterized protein LOC116016751 [Ipomoea triloba]XP_031113000.1 uncharacterized protein LOC116016751 [Ipomoea triloba]